MTVHDVERGVASSDTDFDLTNLCDAVSLAQIPAVQQIAGKHLVGPDGTIALGSHVSVSVVGMTLCGAKAAIENYLPQFF